MMQGQDYKRWVHQNFPTKFFQFLGRQRCVRSSVVMMEDDAIPIDQFAFSRLLVVIFPVVDSEKVKG